jgi:hypothetical protein
MHNEPGWLIDHKYGVVLKNDAKRDLLRAYIGQDRLWQIKPQALSALDLARRCDRLFAKRHAALAQPALERRSRKLRQPSGKRPIEP